MSFVPSVEIGEFMRPVVPSLLRQRRRGPSNKNWNRLLGLVGTLLLHGLGLQTVVLGARTHAPRPAEIQGAGALHVVSTTLAAEELVLVTIGDVQKDDSGLAEQIASLGPQLQNPSIAILSSDPLPATDLDVTDQAPDNSAHAVPPVGDPAMRALMFGRYTGQISARIERAWVRPRSPVNDPTRTSNRDAHSVTAGEDGTFQCRVQIRQDDHGNVQEVLLLQCNGTEAWRHSLMVAINQASPLPAPPIPAVFTRSLTMTFEAPVYQPGSTLDQYEFEPRADVQNHVDARPDANLFPPKTVD